MPYRTSLPLKRSGWWWWNLSFHCESLIERNGSIFGIIDVHTVPRELNSNVNKLIYIPRVITKTYGINSISYKCATLWNKYFKKGEINVDEDKQNNVKLSKIKNKKSFNWILKKHFLHSYTIVPTVVFYWILFLPRNFPT